MRCRCSCGGRFLCWLLCGLFLILHNEGIPFEIFIIIIIIFITVFIVILLATVITTRVVFTITVLLPLPIVFKRLECL